MAMTEEERRQARNEASRRWYLAHKAAKAAQNKAGGAKPKAKKVELKPAKAQQPKTDASKLEKQVDKFVDKAVKTADAYKALVKDAAQVLADVYRTGDEKLVAKACKAFGKRLSLEVVPTPGEGRAELKPSVGAKVFRIPKAASPALTAAPAENDVSPKERVVSVDPSVLTGIEDGSVTAADVDAGVDAEDEDKTDEQRLAELREIDEDELSDDEREEKAELEEIEQEQRDADGAAEAMRELEAQGAYDD